MKSKLVILSKGRGWSNKLSETADYSCEDGVASVKYKIEGDDCSLIISKTCIQQKRVGRMPLNMTFRPGQTTACIIGGADLCGGYRIQCISLNVSFSENGCTADLAYLSGDDREKINIKIRISL